MTNENFDKILKFILEREGGYVNDPNDLGGETNKGITYQTYNEYRKRKGLKTQSVKYITDNEVRDIYYNNYYKASGADKISNPKLSAYVFDTAVNMGVSRAKSLLTQSLGDPDRFEQLRRAKYDEFVQARPNQKRYLEGWNNRVTDLKNFANKNFSSNESMSVKSNHQKIVSNVDKKLNKNENSSKAFTTELRNRYNKIKQETYKKIFKTINSSDKNGKGHWVTINGKHIFIE